MVNGLGGILDSGTFTGPPQTGHRPFLPALSSGTLSDVLHLGHLISIVIGVPIFRDENNFIMDPTVVQEHGGRIRRLSSGGAVRRLL
jgi:hypothetical protein